MVTDRNNDEEGSSSNIPGATTAGTDRDRSDYQWRGGREAQPTTAANYQGGTKARENQEGAQDQRKEQAKCKSLQIEGNPKIFCFRCREEGHHQLDCTNAPICYKCKQSGHMAVECGITHKNKISMYGFGIPGQGFYSIEVPEAKSQNDKVHGLVTLIEGEASEIEVTKELKNLIDDDWGFKVRKLSNEDYIAAFPDELSVEMFSKFNSVDLTLYGLKVKITRTKIGAAVSSVLIPAWLRIYGIPDFAKEEGTVRELASLAPEPIKVDVGSLKGEGPAKVRVNCRDPTKVGGFVEVFFNGVGYELRYVAEGVQGKAQGGNQGGPPGPSNQKDEQDKRKKKDESEGPNRKNPKYSRGEDKAMENDQETSQGDSLDDSLEDLIKDGSPREEEMLHDSEAPVAAYHPKMGFMSLITETAQYSEGEALGKYETITMQQDMVEESQTSALTQEEIPPLLEKPLAEEEDKIMTCEEIPPGKMVVHSLDGPYLMDSSKWPALTEPSRQGDGTGKVEGSGGFQPMEESTMGSASLRDAREISDQEEGGQEWIQSAPKRKGRKQRQPMVATRASTRVPKTGEPMLEKASKRLQERDAILEGKKQCNPFTVLNNASDGHLQNVIRDLEIEVEDIDTQISAFKAEEKLRAALAEANYKCYLERINAKDAPQREEDLANLAMETLDNACRGAWQDQVHPRDSLEERATEVRSTNRKKKK